MKSNKKKEECVQLWDLVSNIENFFIESVKVIGYKNLKIQLCHAGFGLRTKVTLGHLIYDQFKMHF